MEIKRCEDCGRPILFQYCLPCLIEFGPPVVDDDDDWLDED